MKSVAQEFEAIAQRTGLPINMATESAFYFGGITALKLLGQCGQGVSEEVATLRVLDLKAQLSAFFDRPHYEPRKP